MTRILVLLLTCSLGCQVLEKQEVIEEHRELFRIASFDPPKHVYVSLERVSDGKQFDRVYVSKHFNGWREIAPVGKEISIVRQRVKWGDKSFDRFIGVAEAIRNLQ